MQSKTIKKRNGANRCISAYPMVSEQMRRYVPLAFLANLLQNARKEAQGSCSLYCESETVFVHDRSEPLLLLRNKEDLFLKQSLLPVHLFLAPNLDCVIRT